MHTIFQQMYFLLRRHDFYRGEPPQSPSPLHIILSMFRLDCISGFHLTVLRAEYYYSSSAPPPFSLSFITLLFEPAIISLFLIASARPIRRAGLTPSARFTLPICRRLSLDGFGSLSIHSGTGEPDWRRTLAILRVRQPVRLWCNEGEERWSHAFRYGASSSVK